MFRKMIDNKNKSKPEKERRKQYLKDRKGNFGSVKKIFEFEKEILQKNIFALYLFLIFVLLDLMGTITVAEDVNNKINIFLLLISLFISGFSFFYNIQLIRYANQVEKSNWRNIGISSIICILIGIIIQTLFISGNNPNNVNLPFGFSAIEIFYIGLIITILAAILPIIYFNKNNVLEKYVALYNDRVESGYYINKKRQKEAAKQFIIDSDTKKQRQNDTNNGWTDDILGKNINTAQEFSNKDEFSCQNIENKVITTQSKYENDQIPEKQFEKQKKDNDHNTYKKPENTSFDGRIIQM